MILKTKDENPCYCCTERYVDVERGVTCHGTCQRYKEANARHAERKRKIIEQRNEEGIYERYRRIRAARYRHTKGDK